ncbi:hypothetical protein BDZ91DRAFT_767840 [Kalaharituber pfeilii]|nr:hypothetical protein BDZ91DRAFT_767840 [Kalaharituber pfeilii]
MRGWKFPGAREGVRVVAPGGISLSGFVCGGKEEVDEGNLFGLELGWFVLRRGWRKVDDELERVGDLDGRELIVFQGKIEVVGAVGGCAGKVEVVKGLERGCILGAGRVGNMDGRDLDGRDLDDCFRRGLERFGAARRRGTAKLPVERGIEYGEWMGWGDEMILSEQPGDRTSKQRWRHRGTRRWNFKEAIDIVQQMKLYY